MANALTKQSEHFGSLLRRAHLKVTDSRIAILRILDAAPFPLSTASIVKKIGHGADQATVYRTLRALQKGGVLKQIDLEHGHAHFEMADRPEHHHIVCMSCGKVSDFTGCLSEKDISRALKQTKEFAFVNHHSLELFGLCRECNKKEEA